MKKLTLATIAFVLILFWAVNLEEKNIPKNIDPNLEYADLFTEKQEMLRISRASYADQL